MEINIHSEGLRKEELLKGLGLGTVMLSHPLPQNDGIGEGSGWEGTFKPAVGRDITTSDFSGGSFAAFGGHYRFLRGEQ